MYTSGTTGRPKGCQHSTGGYLSYVAGTSKYYQDIHPDDVYWCFADIGWITGHSYIVYGPLSLGTTSVMYEGVPLRSEEHTSELQSLTNLVCRLLLEKKKKTKKTTEPQPKNTDQLQKKHKIRT